MLTFACVQAEKQKHFQYKYAKQIIIYGTGRNVGAHLVQ